MNTPQKPEVKPGPIPYISSTRRDGVTVPFLQAIITGGLFGGFFFLLVLLLAWGSTFIVDWIRWDVVLWLACGGLLFTFFPVAYVTWTRQRQAFHWIMEAAIAPDLNGNGIPDDQEETPPKSATLYLTLAKEGSPDKLFKDLPYAERLPTFARGLAKGANLSGRYWNAAKLFQPDEFSFLMGQMQDIGLVTPKNAKAPNLGYDLTDAGRQWVAALVAEGGRIEQETGAIKPTHIDNFAIKAPGTNGKQTPSPTA